MRANEISYSALGLCVAQQKAKNRTPNAPGNQVQSEMKIARI